MSTIHPPPNADERQPLLTHVVLSDVEEEDDSPILEDSEQKPVSHWTWFLSYGIPITLLSITPGLFIKAFIDSGNVHVSLFQGIVEAPLNLCFVLV